MHPSIRRRLRIRREQVEAINDLLGTPGTRAIDEFLDVVARYGTPEQINRKARRAARPAALREQVRRRRPEHLEALDWLERQRDRGAFVDVESYRRGVLGPRASAAAPDDALAVTLEISACQYFPWLIRAAEWAIEHRALMPARFIRVRKMREQEEDGDLPAMALATRIIGASIVETLDTRGTDGSNVHLGGAETITGYFGGVGQPNDHALRWLDEWLDYYTRYGVGQVLNVNPGTVLLGYLLYRIGVDVQFKISVFVGNDNPYSALWTLLTAKLFTRPDGSSPLVGFNWSNSAGNRTLEISAEVRRKLGFEQLVRFEHHITETWKSIVRQPYDRRAELLEVARHVPNISAKHEGGDPAVEASRPHPSDILDYFRDRAEIEAAGDAEHLLRNFLDKLEALNATARALTENGLAFVAARELHHAAVAQPA